MERGLALISSGDSPWAIRTGASNAPVPGVGQSPIGSYRTS
jgi:hypothetical protein